LSRTLVSDVSPLADLVAAGLTIYANLIE